MRVGDLVRLRGSAPAGVLAWNSIAPNMFDGPMDVAGGLMQDDIATIVATDGHFVKLLSPRGWVGWIDGSQVENAE